MLLLFLDSFDFPREEKLITLMGLAIDPGGGLLSKTLVQHYSCSAE